MSKDVSKQSLISSKNEQSPAASSDSLSEIPTPRPESPDLNNLDSLTSKIINHSDPSASLSKFVDVQPSSSMILWVMQSVIYELAKVKGLTGLVQNVSQNNLQIPIESKSESFTKGPSNNKSPTEIEIHTTSTSTIETPSTSTSTSEIPSTSTSKTAHNPKSSFNSSPGSSTLKILPSLGTSQSEFLATKGLILEHGSSLSLMARVGQFLNDSREFKAISPSDDWEKWKSRRPEFALYYIALSNPAKSNNQIVSVMRCVTDGVQGSKNQKSRIIIDYVTTAASEQGKGYAGILVDFVKQISHIIGAETFVLALEDSCVYWMSKGFILESSKDLNSRINIFSDTHLLRLQVLL